MKCGVLPLLSCALAALLASRACVHAQPANGTVAEESVEASGLAPGGLAAEGAILSLGEADPKLFLVRRGQLWSMHAENLVVSELFEQWKKVGGPEVVSKLEIVDPYTFSVHGLTAERIVARLLEGYGYTLHYAPDGRLERVRVYSPEPTRSFKTPRLVETLGKWREIETTASQPAATEPQAAATEPATAP